MLSKLKIALGVIVTAVIGILYALLKIEKSEKEAAETKAEKFEDAAVENAKVVEEVKREQQIKSDISKLSDDNVLSELQQYNRSRKD